MKTFADYEEKSQALADYPDIGRSPLYPAMGLAGEGGEVLEKVKKIWRDKDLYNISPEDRRRILIEAGDALWYITALAKELDSSLEEVAHLNLEKLNDRKARGTLHGEGDDR